MPRLPGTDSSPARVVGVVLAATPAMGALGALAMLVAIVRYGGWPEALHDDDLLLIPVCFLIGCAVGLLSLPIVVPALARTDLRFSVPVVYGISAVVVVVYALSSHSPFYPLDCALPAFISVCVVSALYGLLYQPPEPPASPVCKECAYDLRGNTSGVCPECGASVNGDRA